MSTGVESPLEAERAKRYEVPVIGWALALVVALLVVSPEAQADYVRDEVRINLRSRPGTQYRILKTIASGDPVEKLAEAEDWVQIRGSDGETGWVPKGYLTKVAPPSVRLPKLEEEVAAKTLLVSELETRIASQTSAVTEVETLRSRNAELETLNLQLAGSSRWRSMGMGALIGLGGILVGAMWPRGGRSRGKLKL